MIQNPLSRRLGLHGRSAYFTEPCQSDTTDSARLDLRATATCPSNQQRCSSRQFESPTVLRDVKGRWRGLHRFAADFHHLEIFSIINAGFISRSSVSPQRLEGRKSPNWFVWLFVSPGTPRRPRPESGKKRDLRLQKPSGGRTRSKCQDDLVLTLTSGYLSR